MPVLQQELGIQYSQGGRFEFNRSPFFIGEEEDGLIVFWKSAHGNLISIVSSDLEKEEILIQTDNCHLQSAYTISLFNSRIFLLFRKPCQVVILNRMGCVERIIPLSIDGIPVSIAVLPDGKFIIGCWKPGAIFMFDEQGNRLHAYTPGKEILKEPRSIVQLWNGLIAILDAGLHHILILDDKYTFQQNIGCTRNPGNGSNQFSSPAMIDKTSSQDILVCDTRNDRITKITLGGGMIHWNGTHDISLFMPKCIKSLRGGGMIVGDTQNNRLLLLNENFVVEKIFGKTAITKQELHFPRSIQATTKATYLIADTYNNRVLEVDERSGILRQINDPPGKPLCWPRCAIQCKDGSILIADSRNDRLVLFDPEGRFVREAKFFHAASETLCLSDPHSVHENEQGEIIITDTGNDRILLVNIKTLGILKNTAKIFFERGVKDPHHVEQYEKGIIISDSGNNRLLILNNNWQLLDEIHTVYSNEKEYVLNEPRCCRFYNGHYLILNSGNSSFLIVNEEREIVWYWNGSLPESPIPKLMYPRWFDILPDKRIAISDYYNSRIVIIQIPEDAIRLKINQ